MDKIDKIIEVLYGKPNKYGVYKIKIQNNYLIVSYELLYNRYNFASNKIEEDIINAFEKG